MRPHKKKTKKQKKKQKNKETTQNQFFNVKKGNVNWVVKVKSEDDGSVWCLKLFNFKFRSQYWITVVQSSD